MPKEKSNEWPLLDAYGICRLSILPIYSKPMFDSALVSQLLFGECYQVIALTPDRNWFKIFQEDTQIQGWVSSDSLKEINASDYQRFKTGDYQVVNSPIAAIEYLGTNLYLLPGSRLHFSDDELFNWKDHIGFTGSVRSHLQKASREELVDIALKYLNTPYQFGGRSIFGMDNRWFFQLIYQIAGYSWSGLELPGKIIDDQEALPGDLLILRFDDSEKVEMAFCLGMDEVLWLGNKVVVTDSFLWENSHLNKSNKITVFETRSILI